MSYSCNERSLATLTIMARLIVRKMMIMMMIENETRITIRTRK